jgi:hypothetical protein
MRNYLEHTYLSKIYSSQLKEHRKEVTLHATIIMGEEKKRRNGTFAIRVEQSLPLAFEWDQEEQVHQKRKLLHQLQWFGTV